MFLSTIARHGVCVVSPLLLLGGVALAESKFDKALIYLERNVTDDDLEVRLEVTGSKAGFAELRVTAPDGRTVIDFKSPDSKLGIRLFELESPELHNDGKIQTDFPQGVYHFEGTFVGGQMVRGEATLSHSLPPAPTVTSPKDDQKDVPLKGTNVQWTAVNGSVSYEVVLEQKGGGRELHATLSEKSTGFAIPDAFMVPGSEYTLAVGAIMKGGNRTFVEIEFETAKR